MMMMSGTTTTQQGANPMLPMMMSMMNGGEDMMPMLMNMPQPPIRDPRTGYISPPRVSSAKVVKITLHTIKTDNNQMMMMSALMEQGKNQNIFDRK